MSTQRTIVVKQIIILADGGLVVNRFCGGKRSIFCKQNPFTPCGDWCQDFEVEYGKRVRLCSRVFEVKEGGLFDLRKNENPDG